jgi:sec-independent protein translocase protein TatA
MPNIGPMELAIVLIIALVIFGPSKLPELGKSAGKGFREFKDSISGDSQDEIEAPQITKSAPAEAAERVNGEVVAGRS